MSHHFSCLRVLKDARLRAFIHFALKEGWHVKLIPGAIFKLNVKVLQQFVTLRI